MKEDFVAKLKRYAELKASIKAMEEEADSLNPDILGYMTENEVKEIPTDVGFFTTYERRTWKYPAEVESIKAEFDAKKKESEQLGTATYKVTTSLRFSTTAPLEAKE